MRALVALDDLERLVGTGPREGAARLGQEGGANCPSAASTGVIVFLEHSVSFGQVAREERSEHPRPLGRIDGGSDPACAPLTAES